MTERILCAAIWFRDTKKYIHQPANIQSGYVICGLRHHNCFYTNSLIYGEEYHKNKVEEMQGFLTSNNRFVSRQEAASIAREANQIKGEFKNMEILYSEDLY